jgi:hypothetical protein
MTIENVIESFGYTSVEYFMADLHASYYDAELGDTIVELKIISEELSLWEKKDGYEDWYFIADLPT